MLTLSPGLPLHRLFGSLVLSFHAYLFLSTVELQQKDRALVELLQEKVGLFAEMTHFQADEDSVSGMPLPALPRGLFRSESLESPRGERLLRDAIREGEGSTSEVSRLFTQTRAISTPQPLKAPEGLSWSSSWAEQGGELTLLLDAPPSVSRCCPLHIFEVPWVQHGGLKLHHLNVESLNT